MSVCLCVCLSVYVSVCPGIMLTSVHSSLSDFTNNLIPRPGRFSLDFRLTSPFLISAITLKLIQATLPLFWSPMFRPRRFITPPFHCSNSECQQPSGWRVGLVCWRSRIWTSPIQTLKNKNKNKLFDPGESGYLLLVCIMWKKKGINVCCWTFCGECRG